MPLSELQIYAQRMLSKGFSKKTIIKQLKQAGYPSAAIDNAFAPIEGMRVSHVIHLSFGTIIAVFAIVIGALGIGGFFFFSGDAPKELLDVSLEIIDADPIAGEAINVIATATNMGSKKSYDIEFEYSLIEIGSGKAVAEKTETKAVSTTVSSNVKIMVPASANGGEYIMRVAASYGSSKATASQRLRVGKAIRIAPDNDDDNEGGDEGSGNNGQNGPEGPIDCNDGDVCTIDMKTGDGCSYEPIRPCCGDGICDDDESNCIFDCDDAEPEGPVETIARAVREALSKLSDALSTCAGLEGFNRDSCYSSVALAAEDEGVCSKISQKTTAQNCYRNVAKKTRDSAICDKITSNDIRDVCYADFLADGDYSVCEKFSQDYFRETCRQIKRESDLTMQHAS